MMNKKDTIKITADKTGFTQKDITTVLDAWLETIQEFLCNGEEINISGFCKFEVSTRAAREGRNPATSEIIQIPETKSPKIKPLTALKEAVKNS